jgi:hypothetical protein
MGFAFSFLFSFSAPPRSGLEREICGASRWAR